MVQKNVGDPIDTNLRPDRKESDERLNSAGTAVGGYSADDFEMETLDHFGGDERSVRLNDREEWLYLKEDNAFKRFFRRLWYGPAIVEDAPPAFPEKWSWTRKVDKFPETGYQQRFPLLSVRICILIVYCCFWSVIFYTFIHYYYIVPPTFYQEDGSQIPIRAMDCRTTVFWKGKNNQCGIGATRCLPFSDEEVYIRCPALCDRESWTYSAINVGDERVKYTGFQIGGGELQEKDKLSYPYRGDSFACGAAVHAGVVSPFVGGCARISMTGEQGSFQSRKGHSNTGMSVNFDSFFPSSFTFRKLLNGYSSRCYDPRIPVVVINIVMSMPVFYLYEGIYGFWILTIVAYLTIVLFLDPPFIVDPYVDDSFSQLLSIIIQRMLPLAFVLYVLWKCCVRRTLTNGSSLAKILCWFPTFWLGVMNNVTFDRLPVDRLTVSDFKEQAGALVAVGSIIATIVSCAIVQAYSLWKSGRFRKYLCIYVTLIMGLFLLGILPGLSLRIHHYILGILLVPGCATRGTSAYLFQGILIGLVLSGVGKWDFASIVETKSTLSRGEAGDSWKPPMLQYTQELPNLLSWEYANTTQGVTEELNAYSLLINDVEHFLGENTTVDIDTLIQSDLKLSQWVNSSVASNGSAKLYLRVARASKDSPEGPTGDYTNAAILEWPLGVYHEPKPGVS
ncbi:LANO_0B06700g1_1 [Lachancea nothofagi CBS 11611]|uniref:LANO_0B06700g1_1 n=1 Tax=Lachancea nothofagi CBS 11611 TaxID=1266666 RepID=A0A1G4IZH2_9SACH|nr:LANO_0B06700g1_1 [Lachancea nothofagi CBS 11611]